MKAIPLPRKAFHTSIPMTKAAHEALKGTPLADAKIYVGGTAATYKDIQDGAKYDLMIVAFAALSLILLIMMIITRSLVAALVIVGTVALSLGASVRAVGAGVAVHLRHSSCTGWCWRWP